MSFFCAFFCSVVCLFLVSNFPLTGASPDIQQLKGSESFQRGHLAETPEGETIASCEVKETINAAATALQKAQQKITEVKNAKTEADGEYERSVNSKISQNITDAKGKWESAKKAIRTENIPASVSRTITSAEGSIKQAESKMAEIASFTEIAKGNKTKAEGEIESIDKKLEEANKKLSEAKEKCKSSADATNGNKATLNNGASQDASSVSTLASEIEVLTKTASESIDYESRFAKNARYAKMALPRFFRTLDGDTTALPDIYATALKKEKAQKEIDPLAEKVKKALQSVEKTVIDINSTVAAIQVLLNEMGTLTTPCAVTELETQKEEAKRQFLKAQGTLQQAETEKEKVKEAVTNVTKASSGISASFSSKSPEELAQSATKAAKEAANAEQSATSQVIAANAAVNAAQSALTNAKMTHSAVTEDTCKSNKKEDVSKKKSHQKRANPKQADNR